MSKPLIYRSNKRFCIDEEQLKPEARTSRVLNALYAAIFVEFKGASKSDKYSNLTYSERIEKVNEFAYNWLNKRKYI